MINSFNKKFIVWVLINLLFFPIFLSAGSFKDRTLRKRHDKYLKKQHDKSQEEFIFYSGLGGDSRHKGKAIFLIMLVLGNAWVEAFPHNEPKHVHEYVIDEPVSESTFSSMMNFLKNSSYEYSGYESREGFNKLCPVLSKDQVKERYNDLKPIDSGTSHRVYSAQRFDGKTIALRVSLYKHLKNPAPPKNLWAYSRLSKLGEQKITDYIPKIYGFYYGDLSEDFISNKFYEGKDGLYSVQEMELLLGSYEDLYGYKNGVLKNVPKARVIFEHAIGEWAVTKLGLSIDDIDGDVRRHHALVYDDRWVAYHIGEKIYLFPPGYSPRKIDYDDAQEISDHEFYFTYDIFFDSRVDDPILKKFISEINNKGLFKAIENNLESFVYRDFYSLEYEDARHYYIPLQ